MSPKEVMSNFTYYLPIFTISSYDGEFCYDVLIRHELISLNNGFTKKEDEENEGFWEQV